MKNKQSLIRLTDYFNKEKKYHAGAQPFIECVLYSGSFDGLIFLKKYLHNIRNLEYCKKITEFLGGQSFDVSYMELSSERIFRMIIIDMKNKIGYEEMESIKNFLFVGYAKKEFQK